MSVEDWGSGFARWLVCRGRVAGYDTENGGVRALIVMLAQVAVDRGLTPGETAVVAELLGVGSEEVTAAYVGEMRERAMMRLLEHPDLGVLDVYLDDVADER
ncbi:hypothetical protein [Streptomyces goshikiensis]|uniref:hypothetical protein n=1 Tax=Streptomyces goshikiensis TaxID=1942 RepID=UPI003651E35A